MKKVNELMQEIIALTSLIDSEYPELYRNIDETPLSLSSSGKGISTTDLESYLNTLKEQLHEHITLHKEHIET